MYQLVRAMYHPMRAMYQLVRTLAPNDILFFIFYSGKYIIRIKHYQLTEYQYIISLVYTPLISSLYSIDTAFILHSYHFYT